MGIEKPIIFIGVGRAGTTIISEIIFQHEDIAVISPFQVKFPNSPAINRLRPLLENKFWRINGQKKQLNKVSLWNKYTFKPMEGYPFWEKLVGNEIDFSRDFLINQTASKERKEYIRNFFEKLVKYQKRKRLGFKITGPSRIEYLNSIFPDAIFIEVVREPLANIRSLLKVDFWQGKGTKQLWWKGAYTDDELKEIEKLTDFPELITAVQYKKVREITNSEVQKFGVKHLQVSYDDFVANPNKEIDRIISFANLKPSKAINSYLKNNKIHDRNTDINNFFNSEQLLKIREILKNI